MANHTLLQLHQLGERLKPLRNSLALCTSPQYYQREDPELDVLRNHFHSKLDPISKILFCDIWLNDPNEVQLSLKQLANLCFHDILQNRQANRQRVFEVGGFSMIVGAMNSHTDSAGIQSEACRCLLNVCMDSNWGKAACDVGALNVVLAAMQRFAQDCYLQRVGCGALHALTKNNAQTAKRLVLELNGSFKVVRSMRNFTQSRRLQMWACCCLADWAQWPDLRQRLLDSGSLTALNVVVDTFQDASQSEDVAIQDKARGALRYLS